jgi:hypothetical protein
MKVEWFEITSRVFNKPLILSKEDGFWVLRTDYQDEGDSDVVAQGKSIDEVIERFTKTLNGQLLLDFEELKNLTFEE